MMTARAEPKPKAPPVAIYCRACSGWIGTVPAGTPWFRGRCINKRCQKYAVAQQVKVDVIR